MKEEDNQVPRVEDPFRQMSDSVRVYYQIFCPGEVTSGVQLPRATVFGFSVGNDSGLGLWSRSGSNWVRAGLKGLGVGLTRLQLK